MGSNNSCPMCGYPDTEDGQHFKGIYTFEKPCPHCRFSEVPPDPRLSDLGIYRRLKLEARQHIREAFLAKYVDLAEIPPGQLVVLLADHAADLLELPEEVLKEWYEP